jgi:hypothetical protein
VHACEQPESDRVDGPRQDQGSRGAMDSGRRRTRHRGTPRSTASESRWSRLGACRRTLGDRL